MRSVNQLFRSSDGPGGERLSPIRTGWELTAGVNRVVIVSPHSDDAAFSIPLSIQGLLIAGTPTVVLTIFSTSGYCTGQGPRRRELANRIPVYTWTITRRRRSEDRAFAKTTCPGLEMEWLGLRDAPLRGHAFADLSGPLETAEENAMISGELSSSLAKWVENGHTALLAPAALGRHLDHRVALLAALQLKQRGGWLGPLFLYEDLPYAARYGLDAIELYLAELAERHGVCARPLLVYCRDAVEVKRKAAMCYPSQVTPKCLEEIVAHGQRLANGEGEGAERLWRIVPKPMPV